MGVKKQYRKLYGYRKGAFIKKKKKWIALILSVAMVLGLAACGGRQNRGGETSSRNESQSNETETSTEPSRQEGGSSSETAMGTQEGSSAEMPAETPEASGGKTLVVYYSASGNTKEVADYIAAAMDGDLFEIVPTEIYTSADLDWTNKDSRVSREHDNEDERNVPLVSDTVDNWDEYDTVFIGYPIWWGIAAWPVDGFIKANDFTGKTVIPFCTSSSSGLGESGELLEEMAGNGEWLEGERFHSGASEETVRSWVEGLGL